MKQKLLIVWIIMCMSMGYAQAQVIFSGHVTEQSTGASMSGVRVFEKGTSNGTVTNDEGYYELKVSTSDAVLIFDYIGHKTLQQQGAGDISMIEDALQLDDMMMSTNPTAATDTQVRIVSGQILDASTGQKLAGVSVCIKGFDHCVLSDSDGQYIIKLPANSDNHLVFTLAEYNTVTQVPSTENISNVLLSKK